MDAHEATAGPPSLTQVLAGYSARTGHEAADLERVRALVSDADDPWLRSLPLHTTASAVIVHPPTRRVLLRWHARQNGWLHVGGHGDPGETQPLTVALREAHEETGLGDLVPWPDAELRHVTVVAVPASTREPAHEHADLRFVLATWEPDAARPENPTAELRWSTLAEAGEITMPNLRETLARVAQLLAAGA